jgi:hypothetical protein
VLFIAFRRSSAMLVLSMGMRVFRRFWRYVSDLACRAAISRFVAVCQLIWVLKLGDLTFSGSLSAAKNVVLLGRLRN